MTFITHHTATLAAAIAPCMTSLADVVLMDSRILPPPFRLRSSRGLLAAIPEESTQEPVEAEEPEPRAEEPANEAAGEGKGEADGEGEALSESALQEQARLQMIADVAERAALAEHELAESQKREREGQKQLTKEKKAFQKRRGSGAVGGGRGRGRGAQSARDGWAKEAEEAKKEAKARLRRAEAAEAARVEEVARQCSRRRRRRPRPCVHLAWKRAIAFARSCCACAGVQDRAHLARQHRAPGFSKSATGHRGGGSRAGTLTGRRLLRCLLRRLQRQRLLLRGSCCGGS